MDKEFIAEEHDGAVRDDAHEMSGHAAIKAHHALLPQDQTGRLPQGLVPTRRIIRLLPHPRPQNLMRIRQDGRHQLCRSRRPKEIQPRRTIPGPRMNPLLHMLIDHPLHRRLDHAQVGGGEALVEGTDALVFNNARETMPGGGVETVGGGLELHAGLDEPYGVGDGGGGDSGHGGCPQMHIGGAFVAAVQLAQNMLALGVGGKVDGPRRHHPNHRRPNALPQSPNALGDGHLLQHLHCSRNMSNGRQKDTTIATSKDDTSIEWIGC